MILLKQSTAVTIPLGPFLDDTDGKTPETGLTITQPDIRLSKSGGTFAQCSAAGTLSHMENGYYSKLFSTTDTNTQGHLKVHIHKSGALPVTVDCMVLTANAYDALMGSDFLQVDAREWLGGAIATPTNSGVPEVDVVGWLGTTVATPTAAGVPEVDLTHVLGTGVVASSGTLSCNVIQAGGTAIQAASGRFQVDVELWLGSAPNALSSGRLDATVGAMQTDVLTSTALANSAVTEVQSGLSSQSSVDTITGYLDTEIAAIKSQTDKLTFDGDNHLAGNLKKISDSAAAADNLEAGTLALVRSTCASGSTTTVIETNLTEATNDHYNGRAITFYNGNLAGQSREILDYNGVTKQITVAALTEAPANTDAFVIS